MKSVGERIRAYRTNQELTLADLSDRTGLDLAFLEAVEEKDLYPSLGPLLKIARALGVRLGTFMDDHISSDPLVVRKDERKEEMAMHSPGDAKTALIFHSLGKGKSDRHMEPFFIDILPESQNDTKLSSHEGEEFIMVASGKVRVQYGEEDVVLEQGDTIYFNSVVPHRVVAAEDAPAQIFAVLYFPE